MLLVHISSVAVVGEECLLPRRRFGFVMLELPFRGDALQHFAEMAVATARLPVTNTITLPSDQGRSWRLREQLGSKEREVMVRKAGRVQFAAKGAPLRPARHSLHTRQTA